MGESLCCWYFTAMYHKCRVEVLYQEEGGKRGERGGKEGGKRGGGGGSKHIWIHSKGQQGPKPPWVIKSYLSSIQSVHRYFSLWKSPVVHIFHRGSINKQQLLFTNLISFLFVSSSSSSAFLFFSLLRTWSRICESNSCSLIFYK